MMSRRTVPRALLGDVTVLASIQFESRGAEGHLHRLPALAEDLVTIRQPLLLRADQVID